MICCKNLIYCIYSWQSNLFEISRTFDIFNKKICQFLISSKFDNFGSISIFMISQHSHPFSFIFSRFHPSAKKGTIYIILMANFGKAASIFPEKFQYSGTFNKISGTKRLLNELIILFLCMQTLRLYHQFQFVAKVWPTKRWFLRINYYCGTFTNTLANISIFFAGEIKLWYLSISWKSHQFQLICDITILRYCDTKSGKNCAKKILIWFMSGFMWLIGLVF